MKYLKRNFLVLVAMAMIVPFFLTGCIEDSAATKETKKVLRQQDQFAIAQPVPAFDWSFERDLVIQLYKLRNEKVATWTVWRSDYGMIEGHCQSIGYGIPYDTSLTNPWMATDEDQNGGRNNALASIGQAEPNGVFQSQNTTATWVMEVDPKTGLVAPLYIESKVTVYPYPIKVDYDTNRVYRVDGAANATINIGK